ncbi:MAG: GNAT family N-acetyltransferase/peptidase C39 family protein [Pseudohongiellaceae bacterium]
MARMVNRKEKGKDVRIRRATASDWEALVRLEATTFDTDRLSPRQMKTWLKRENCVFLVAVRDAEVLGYVLVLLHRGTRLSRVYSLAVHTNARGHGLGRRLLSRAEVLASQNGRLFMRLEVAVDNQPAVALYKSMGYVAFGTYQNYYEDHRPALRMQKRIRYPQKNLLSRRTPWFQQSLEFSCGPASLMMAMASLNRKYRRPKAVEELSIWRRANTVYMTTGLAGCHPVGLALAAEDRGYKTQVYINKRKPLFVDSVRSQYKKDVLALVDKQFKQEAKGKLAISYSEITQNLIADLLGENAAIIILISTYRLDGRKAPHWVVVTGIDDVCLYVHDPDPDEGRQTPLDCQNIPIARKDFAAMSAYGSEKLRTAVVIRPTDTG